MSGAAPAHYHSQGVDRTREFLDLAASIGGPSSVAAHPLADAFSSQLNPRRVSAHAAGTPLGLSGNGGPVGGTQFPPSYVDKGGSTATGAGPLQNRSAFMRAASEVSQELHVTSQKLAALTRLVKRRGLLADPGEEIERLTASVKGDITALTNKLDSLQSYVQAKKEEAAHVGAVAGGKTLSQGGASNAAAGGSSASSSSSSSLADPVMSTVQGLNHGDVVLASLKGHLLTFGKNLKGILQSRAESLKSQAGRRHALGAARDLGRPTSLVLGAGGGNGPMAFSRGRGASGSHAEGQTAGADADSSSPHTALSIGGSSSSSSSSKSQTEAAALFKPGQSSAADARARRLGLGGSSAANGSSNSSSSSVSLPVGGATAPNAGNANTNDPFAFVTQAQLLPDAENAYLDTRASDVQALERHIGDLGQLFSRLATVVSEQGELVGRIEDNVSSALVNMEASANVLQRAWDRARNNGSLAIKITGILLFFILLFVFFGT